MKTIKRIMLLNLVLVLVCSPYIYGQIRYGSIEYEIKVNTEKRFASSSQQNSGFSRQGRRRSSDTENKHLIEKAVLYFNDTMSIFVTEPLENIADQNRTFLTTSKVNFMSNVIETQINLFGEYFLVQDERPKHVWKFTNKMRSIAGKNAKQAITQINDSTTIYAWFDTDFYPTIGPESYSGLPGAILGLAYEDGAVTYFATKITTDYPDMQEIWKPNRARKEYTRKDFEKEFSQKYKTHRYARLISDLLHFY